MKVRDVKIYTGIQKTWEPVEHDLTEETCSPGTWLYLNNKVTMDEAKEIDKAGMGNKTFKDYGL